MASNKTQPTDASIEAYLASRGSDAQRTDCHALMAIMKKVTKQPPKMWGRYGSTP